MRAINWQTPQNYCNISKQMIWYNSHIKTQGAIIKPIADFPKELSISDMINDKGEHKSFEQFCEDLQIKSNKWLEYQSIWAAIPNYWKIVLANPKDELCETYTDYFEFICTHEKISRAMYKQLNKDDSTVSKTARYWNSKLTEFDFSIHIKSFQNIYRVTNTTKYRNFQYRLLHNKIFCNNVLFHWHKVNTQACDFCPHLKQDIVHLLCKCPRVEPIWKNIKVVFKYSILDWSDTSLIYNLVHPKVAHVINFIVLVVKFAIFRCKCAGEIPNFYVIWSEVKDMYYIEYEIAQRNNQVHKYKKKWNPVKFLFE